LRPTGAVPFLPAANDKNPLDRRTRDDLLLLLNKADQGVAEPETPLTDRGDAKPPVDKLLLARAYLETDQAG
jgi:hypothetical protein